MFGLISCSQQLNTNKDQISRAESWNSEHLVQSVLWYQHSPEMQALYIQSFNIAKKALAENIEHKIHKEKKNAVVVDIDETILNNSLYEGWLSVTGNSYDTNSWNKWLRDAQAEPLPGTIDFLNYAANDLKCEVFYISNRDHESTASTLQNMKKHNLPHADEKHLLLKTRGDTTSTGETTKEKRRLKIENEMNCEILLLCGDQMADFDKAFDVLKNSTEVGIKDSLEMLKNKFGIKFIILPNPMYSEWLNFAIYKKDRNKSFMHLDSLRKKKINYWRE